MHHPHPDDFLSSCSVIDFDHEEVLHQAERLQGDSEKETVNRCFEFVRDQIQHSSDFELNPVTLSASEVLRHRTGYCYAKSHLLAALLRANRIPTGLCYQRLAMEETITDSTRYCLHGLNAVFLQEHGWYRVDARGNRSDVDAQFRPPQECLAFPVQLAGECDLTEIHISPRPEIVECLESSQTWQEVIKNLPDAR